MCGEHASAVFKLNTLRGSSPRVWGTLHPELAEFEPWRIIPTCVGNTSTIVTCHLLSPDHPHVCGEHERLIYRLPFHRGSSPRVWGTHLNTSFFKMFNRIIPTCVGNTNPAQLPAQAQPDHPHVCGEHLFLYSLETRTAGSSPRVWGTLFL